MRARLLCFLGNAGLLAEHADQLFAIGVDQGFPYWRAQGLIYSGWAKVTVGDIDAGVAIIHEGVMACQATGALTWLPLFHGLEAEAEALRGQADRALTILDKQLQTSRCRSENWFEAELLRLRGYCLQGRDPEEAEKLFKDAIRVAQRQEAKLWELRATMSLTRLRWDEGLRAEAHDVLAPVYNWFTEGFDTPDLKEAKSLLDELG